MSETCTFCGNMHLTRKTTRYLHHQGEDMLIVDNVPCVECDFCGEQYFAIDVLKKIEGDHEAIAQQRKKPCRTLRWPSRSSRRCSDAFRNPVDSGALQTMESILCRSKPAQT